MRRLKLCFRILFKYKHFFVIHCNHKQYNKIEDRNASIYQSDLYKYDVRNMLLTMMDLTEKIKDEVDLEIEVGLLNKKIR